MTAVETRVPDTSLCSLNAEPGGSIPEDYFPQGASIRLTNRPGT